MNMKNTRRQKLITRSFRLFIFIILILNILHISPQFYEDNMINEVLMKIDKSPLTSSTSLNYELIWERAWRMDLETQGGKKIAIDSNDNIYQTGYWLLESINQAKVILIKRNSAGNKIWSITWGYDESEYGRDVAIDSDDNIYVCGTTQNSNTGYRDMFLVKFVQVVLLK